MKRVCFIKVFILFNRTEYAIVEVYAVFLHPSRVRADNKAIFILIITAKTKKKNGFQVFEPNRS